jgi:hypothetical protein
MATMDMSVTTSLQKPSSMTTRALAGQLVTNLVAKLRLGNIHALVIKSKRYLNVVMSTLPAFLDTRLATSALIYAQQVLVATLVKEDQRHAMVLVVMMMVKRRRSETVPVVDFTLVHIWNAMLKVILVTE